MSDKKLRLLILTQYFPPETGAPQARLSEMALLLKDKGVEVEVLTAMPNYPAGKIFDDYKGKWFMRDEWRGLPIVRSFIYPTKNPGIVPRLLNYFSFVFSSILAGLFMCKRADVILVESPPLFLGIAGYALKLLKRAKLIFNVSDLWPETAVALGLFERDSTLVNIATRLEKFLYKTSAACTGQSYGIARGIVAKHPGARVALIPNGADCAVFSPVKRNRNILSPWKIDPDKTVVGYAGLLGIAQGIKLILDSAQKLAHEKDIVFLIVGDGPEREMLEKEAGSNVVFAGLVPKDNMPEIVASFDMTIIPLKTHIPGALPSKIYEAMASEIPVILAAEGDPRELLNRAQGGIAVDYNDVQTVSDAIMQLKSDNILARQLGQQGRNYVMQYHDRSQIAAKFHKTLVSTLSNDNGFFDAERKSIET